MAMAQEGASNFDACVSEAKQRHTDAIMETYFSYKCDGVIAQRLAARPDQCGADVRPSRSRIQRSSRQLEDGLYLRMIWRTGVCAGMCETRIYSDARETRYLCEVRRHIVGTGVPDGGPRHYPPGRRGPDEYAPEGSVYPGVTNDERMARYLGWPRKLPEERGDGPWASCLDTGTNFAAMIANAAAILETPLPVGANEAFAGQPPRCRRGLM
jgi:hypothetical protein